MKTVRIAALDIGSNSIRCIIVEADETGAFRILDDEKSTVRLGQDLNRDGNIAPEAIERAVEAIDFIQKLIQSMRVDVVEAIATSAIRRAGNGDRMIELLSGRLGHTIKVISGLEEAALAVLSAQRHFDMDQNRYAVFDIGGGSLEITIVNGGVVESSHSFDLGAVFMTEQFVTEDPVSPTSLKRLQSYVKEQLKNELPSPHAVQTVIGSGGTVTALGYLAVHARGAAFASLHGSEILRSEVIHVLSMLGRKNVRERRQLPGLSSDRADIIIAGVAVIDAMMLVLKANRLFVNGGGVREGLILRAMERHGLLPMSSPPRSWRESVRSFAVACQSDLGHAEHVAGIALTLFDTLKNPLKLSARDRVLLEAAALLHDVGYFIAYSSHHKHSYHLVRHAELFGFSPEERELVAQVARYHRKSLPKLKHQSYASLTDADKCRVDALGGILRVADGLDRGRCSSVRKVRCKLATQEVRIDVSGAADLSLEIRGGLLKKDLLERTIGVSVLITAVHHEDC